MSSFPLRPGHAEPLPPPLNTRDVIRIVTWLVLRLAQYPRRKAPQPQAQSADPIFSMTAVWSTLWAPGER